MMRVSIGVAGLQVSATAENIRQAWGMVEDRCPAPTLPPTAKNGYRDPCGVCQ